MDDERLLAGETEIGMDVAYQERQERQGQPLVTVVYSVHGDIYRVPSANADLWLSVQVDTEPHSGTAVETADGKGWRRAYKHSSVIYAGTRAALPADDPLVVDYLKQVRTEPSIPKSPSPASQDKET